MNGLLKTLKNSESQVEEPSLGNYVIHESTDFLPNVIKNTDLNAGQQGNELWKLFFDGSRSKTGAGGGCMLISPVNERYYASFRFTFSCTNNVAEYEALINELKWAIKRGISCLRVYGDSELIVNQVRNVHVTKNDLLKSYKHVVWDLIERFEAFNLQSVPRDQNKHADKLAAIGA